MTSAGKTLTTIEYSKISGISVSTVTKMLRDGKLRGQKINGKWAIDADESQKVGVKESQPATTAQHAPAPSTKKRSQPAASGGKTYDITTFTNMTYLTEHGVRQWFKSGRLSGRTDEQGNLLIDAENLDRPEMRHLIRH